MIFGVPDYASSLYLRLFDLSINSSINSNRNSKIIYAR